MRKFLQLRGVFLADFTSTLPQTVTDSALARELTKRIVSQRVQNSFEMDKTDLKETQENTQNELENEKDNNQKNVSDETAASPETAELGDQTSDEEQINTEDEVNKLKNEIAESKDKYLRLYSEFENFRRRTSREKLELIQSANEQLIKSLLPVLDDFERAQNVLQNRADEPEIQGLLLIQNKMRKTMEVHGVKQMEIGKGPDFHIDMHEAISQRPGDETLNG